MGQFASHLGSSRGSSGGVLEVMEQSIRLISVGC